MKVKKLKSKVKYLKYDLESLEDRIEVFEENQRRRKKVEMKVMRVVITIALISCSIAGVYSVFFK